MKGLPNSEIIVTYLNITLYAISYQLQRPVEPFLVRSLLHNESNSANEEESTALTYGRLTSFFSLIQTVGSPLVGTLLDRLGPRLTSIIVYFASALSYWILANAKSKTWLYWSKVPTLMQHAFLVGQATVASTSISRPAVATSDGKSGSSDSNLIEDKDRDAAMRAAALGRMTTAYTIGATVGPALGGYLASEDLYAGAWLAVWGSLVSVALSIIYLKDRSKSSSSKNQCKGISKDASIDTPKSKPAPSNFLQSLKNTLHFLYHPKISPLLFIKLLNGISSSAYTTVLPLILAGRLSFTPADVGYLMSSSSLSVAVFGAVGISPMMKLLSGGSLGGVTTSGNGVEKLAAFGLGARCLSVLILGLIVSSSIMSTQVLSEQGEDTAGLNRTLIRTSVASIAVSISSHMHATCLTTIATGSVIPEERGALIGLEHGIYSMARIIGPPLGTWLLSNSVLSSLSSDSGVDGLWRVISICALLDLSLMMVMHFWTMGQQSSREQADGSNSSQISISSSSGKARFDDHDHSD